MVDAQVADLIELIQELKLEEQERTMLTEALLEHGLNDATRAKVLTVLHRASNEHFSEYTTRGRALEILEVRDKNLKRIADQAESEAQGIVRESLGKIDALQKKLAFKPAPAPEAPSGGTLLVSEDELKLAGEFDPDPAPAGFPATPSPADDDDPFDEGPPTPRVPKAPARLDVTLNDDPTSLGH